MKLICFLILIAFAGCSKHETLPKGIPNCIKHKVRQLEGEQVQNPLATVWQYEYQERLVYSVSADCCDQFDLVYDSQCNVVCSPSGGFTGKGDGKCPDFAKEAKNAVLIWQDNRTP